MQLIADCFDSKEIACALAHRFNLGRSDELCAQACNSALQSADAGYVFFARFTTINGFAGSLVARLASNLGLSRGIFRDPLLTDDIAECDMQVAHHVFAAAIDEFGDRLQPEHSHKVLAQATLEAVASFAGLNRRRREALHRLPAPYQPLVQAFISHYQGSIGDARSLIRALGFHLASELRAHSEFTIVDDIFCHSLQGRAFANWLQQHPQIQLAGRWVPSWYWVTAHGHVGGCGVEWQHFERAISAIRLARRFSPVPVNEFDAWVEDGFKGFIRLFDKGFQLMAAECQALAHGDVAAGMTQAG